MRLALATRRVCVIDFDGIARVHSHHFSIICFGMKFELVAENPYPESTAQYRADSMLSISFRFVS